MFKKKYLGGYGLLFGVLCCLFVGFLSTSCYADSTLTPINQMTPDIFKQILLFLSEKNSYSYIDSTVQTNYNNFYSIVSDTQIETFCNNWNSKDYSSYADYLEQCIFFVAADGNNTPQLLVSFNNNTIGNRSLHTKVFYTSSSVEFSSINDNGNSIQSVRYAMAFNTGGSIWFGGPYNTSSSGFTINFFSSNFINAYSFIDNSNYQSNLMVCYNMPQSTYTYLPLKGDGGYSWKWLNGDSVVSLPEPEPEPEPDNNGTGTITNNSGDKTGNIDLSGIETGLTNIQTQISGDSQKIINQISGDNAKIVNAINNSNQNYWGSSGDLTGDEQTEAIEDNLNNLMASLSGDLSQNQIYQQLEGAEDGFLDFFRSQNDEQWYDLAFEWNDVYYQGVKLIEAGNINISKMCREIPELGNIQAIIRTIFNFSCAIALICQIYNLILSTLGIDNPYLYEDGAEVTSIDTDSGEYRQRYIKRRRKL